MKNISTEDYPTPRPWSMKAQAAPNIPRGNSMVSSLRIILNDIASGKPQTFPADIPGSNSEATLGRCCQSLRPAGLVRDAKGIWSLSEEAELWLSSKDNNYLASIFCANIKFFSEILNLLQQPLKASELQEVAVNQYFMPWHTKSEINRRTVWLKDLGLIEYHEHSMLYELTETGREFLKHIDIVSPDSISNEKATTEPIYKPSPWAISLCSIEQDELKNRKESLGYCPGGKSELVPTISAYISFLENKRNKDEIENFSLTNYGIKPSSARSFITTLTGLKFIERISRNDYQATDIAIHWNKQANPVDICCCLQKTCLFVFELLQELKDGPKTKNDLSAAAVVKYGFEKENDSEVSRRLHFLQYAGLVKDYKSNEFILTRSGEDLLNLVPIQTIHEQTDSLINQNSLFKTQLDDDKLLTELRLSSRDSANPDRFEKACAAAFRRLGFKAEWLGGSGQTDVLVSAYSAAKYAYRITVDAKSTANGLVNETQLNFDTLVDHRKLHDAQFTVVVGCGFQGDRIVSRAIKHNIVLMDVDSLCELLTLHEKAPLSAQDYKKLFGKYGTADLSVLDIERSYLVRNGNLLHAIMDCLTQESDDLVTGGTLSVREIYFLLKGQNDALHLEISEIENMLNFLSSPMINCVGKNKEEYYAIGSLNEASNKFAFYAKACLDS